MNRIGMALGAGLVGIALIAGCAEEDAPGDEGILDGDDTEVTATVGTGVDSSPTMMPTDDATEEATEDATADATPAGTTDTEGSDEPSIGMEIIITEDGAWESDDVPWVDPEYAVGDTIEFTNEDDEPHTITSADGSIDSGEIAPGDTYEHTFEEAGEYELMLDDDDTSAVTVTVTEDGGMGGADATATEDAEE